MRAFIDCPGLIGITVDAQSLFYSSLNGVLFDKPQHTLVKYPDALVGSYVIPASVTSIGEWAFAGPPRLTGVTFDDNVTNISAYAFYGCPGYGK
jgi:hypothetical protein